MLMVTWDMTRASCFCLLALLISSRCRLCGVVVEEEEVTIVSQVWRHISNVCQQKTEPFLVSLV